MASIVSEQPAVEPRRWRDRKRYAWLLGLIVPTLPFLAWGLVELTGFGVFWFYGPFLVFGGLPAPRPRRSGWTRRTRPTA